MKAYFEELKVTFYKALKEVQQSEDKKVFMLGCRDAGNYDYLFIIGSDLTDRFSFMHIDYSRMITFDSKEVIEDWFKQGDDGFYEDYEDLFEYGFITMEELQDHMNNYVENYI